MENFAALLDWASDRIEEAGIPPGREANWALQRRHQAEWMVPALEAVWEHGRERLWSHAAGLAHPYDPQYRVLDLGCAYGTFSLACAALGADVVGVDWHTMTPGIDSDTLRFYRWDIEDGRPLKWSYNGPDCVALLEVLEHMHCHPRGLFRRIREALTDGGLFVGSTPDPDVWPEPVPPSDLASMPDALPMDQRPDRHVRLYTPDEVTGLLTEAGFCGIAIDRDGAPRYHWRAQ